MKIGYLGAGTWGMALANLLVKNKHEVTVWDIDNNLIKTLNKKRIHPKFKDFQVPKEIKYVDSLEEAINGCDIIIESVTSSGIRPVFEKVYSFLKETQIPIVITSKGIEQKSGLLFSEVITEIIGKDNRNLIGCLSGPSVANEVIKGLPASVVSSSYDQKLMILIADIFNSPIFRVYPNPDILGVAFGGAMKNIIATK